MNITIGKVFQFDAAHHLPDASCYGKCRNLHGHTYTLEVRISGPITDKGWVMNFGDLTALVQRELLRYYDHANLNEFFEVPTAENMVAHIFKVLQQYVPAGCTLHAVKLWETPTSYAEVSGG